MRFTESAAAPELRRDEFRITDADAETVGARSLTFAETTVRFANPGPVLNALRAQLDDCRRAVGVRRRQLADSGEPPPELLQGDPEAQVDEGRDPPAVIDPESLRLVQRLHREGAGTLGAIARALR